MSSTNVEPKVIVVIGKTASGKSRYAVDVAKVLGSVIISADAFQVYREYHVASDKILESEMDGVAHHAIDVVPPSEEFTVKGFLELVIPIVEAELRAGRSPVVVGGTHMYIEKLLFTSRLDAESPETSTTKAGSLDREYTHQHLSEIDPVMACRIHPNDHRRLERAVDFYYNSGGKRMSDDLRSQVRQLRWPNNVVICKTSSTPIPDEPPHKRSKQGPSPDQAALEEKIRLRVEQKMIENGALKKELLRIKEAVEGGKMRWNKGLLQAIGYREFQAYLESTDLDESLFTAGVEQMIRNTIKYSKQQRKWITRLDKYFQVHYVHAFDRDELFSILRDPRPVLKNGSVPQWQPDPS